LRVPTLSSSGRVGRNRLAMIDEELLASIAKQMMSGNTGDAD
jgi:hypothetical protein